MGALCVSRCRDDVAGATEPSNGGAWRPGSGMGSGGILRSANPGMLALCVKRGIVWYLRKGAGDSPTRALMGNFSGRQRSASGMSIVPSCWGSYVDSLFGRICDCVRAIKMGREGARADAVVSAAAGATARLSNPNAGIIGFCVSQKET